tara:strand:+ start:1806 stop:1961 length:156 start_codon:yes stop_codon:yes gene_type:complete
MQKTEIKIVKHKKAQKAKGTITRKKIHFGRDELEKNKREHKVNRREKRKVH